MTSSSTDPAIPDVHRTMGGGSLTPTSHHDTYNFIRPTQFNLDEKVAVISGASYGIGRTIALSLTKARVSGLVLLARGSLADTEAAITKVAGEASLQVPRVLSLKVDVTDEKSVENAAHAVRDEWPGGIDILISNAGWLEPELTITDSNPEDWWSSLAINLKGPYLMGRSFIPLLLLKQNGLKTVLNTVSIGAHMIFPGMSAYNTAKVGVCRLTEYEDAEYSDQGLIAISMHPGGVMTNMGLRLPPEKQKMLTDTHELVSDTTVWCTAERRPWLSGRYVSVQW